MAPRPRVTPLQRDILTKLADGWNLGCDGASCCWLEYNAGPSVTTMQDVPMFTAERLILRNLIRSTGSLMPDGWRAIGREAP